MSGEHPAVLRYARSFSRSTGLEYEELLQVGRIAVWRAELAVERGNYDPHASSFATYATNCVRMAMCKELAAHRHRVSTADLGEEATVEDLVDDYSVSPDGRLVIAQLVRDLPDDARAVVELVLGDVPGEVLDAVLAGARGASQRLRSYIRRTLGMRRGDRAETTFGSIARALRETEDADDYDIADRLWRAAVGG
jgi:RNA polymerase sigma factor (sigma-70 family)